MMFIYNLLYFIMFGIGFSIAFLFNIKKSYRLISLLVISGLTIGMVTHVVITDGLVYGEDNVYSVMGKMDYIHPFDLKNIPCLIKRLDPVMRCETEDSYDTD